jgi:hypothetical protein
MIGPPKQKRARAKSAFRKLRLHTAYRIAAIIATAFAWQFWLSERWRGRMADQIDNEGRVE